MNVLHDNSLSKTLDAFEEVVFYGQELNRAHAEELARWIGSSEGKARSYSTLPAPMPFDYKEGFHTFTGEQITSRASIGHILGEEAGRALALLKVDDPGVQDALSLAIRAVSGFYDRDLGDGFFCCGKCSVAMWRFLSVSSIKNAEERLANGIRLLSSRNDGTGKWKAFPFYYTLLGLSCMPGDLARSEMLYAAPTCERLLKRNVFGGQYGKRRRDLLERILERC